MNSSSLFQAFKYYEIALSPSLPLILFDYPKRAKVRNLPSNFFQPSNRIPIVCQLVCSRTIADWHYYNWIAEINLDGLSVLGFSALPVHIFSCNPVVMESIWCRKRAKQFINDSKTTGWVEKNWTGIK